jgi:hypothetical protein
VAITLNSGLPAGSKGLWWFAQGLENLGTAATGDAVLSGDAGQLSTLVGGKVVHDNVSDFTELTANPADFAISNAVTIMLGYTWSDTTLRNNGGFGLTANDGQKLGAHFPWSDANIYWDFGASRLTYGNTKDTNPHVWGFTVGARGMEVWRDGVKVASNATTPTRTDGTNAYRLGRHGGATSELGSYAWFFLHSTQLSEALIGDISTDPQGELTEGALDGSFQAAWAARATVTLGGRIV